MKALDIWEARLTSYFNSGLRLLGEIPLSFSDVEDMAEGVKGCILDHKLAKATAVLTHKYPQTLITFMSAFAAYNTQQNYWQAFADRIGVEKAQLNNQRWHHEYVRLAENRGLKVFSFKDDPTPYVTSIRFQGGIPAHSLPDYFEKMVLPAVERPGLRDVQPKEALKHLLANVYLVDSPVLDFLQNSGDLGVDFFAESCKLARHVIGHYGAMPPAGTVNLPEYLLAAFADYWEHREDTRQHWRKPWLQAAPYSEDTAILNLPQQEIPLDMAASRLFWQVAYPGVTEREVLNCRVSRSRQNAITKEDFLAVPSPVGNIEVSLHAVTVDTDNPVELRRWNLPLLPPAGRIPLAAFSEDGQQIAFTRQLPAGVLFLLLPLNSQPVFEGTARLVEACVPLAGAWQAWKMERWDLSLAWSIGLVSNGQPLGDIIPVTGAIAQPDLVDGHLFQYQDLDEPLYTSGLPSVRVPLSPGGSLQVRLSEWQVRVCPVAEASPCTDTTVNLSKYATKVQIVDDRAIFPLQNILDANAAGIYDIRVWGPRGLRAEFRVRLWPKLMVFSHSMQLVQPADPPQPAIFMLKLPSEAECQPQAGNKSVQVRRTSFGWEVTAPLELNRVPLDLTMPGQGGATVRVPVSIPLPRPHWGLASGKEGSALEWGYSLLHRSIDQMLQSGSASLHVEMYSLGSLNPDLKVRLTEISDAEGLVQEAKLTHTDFKPDWLRVSLGQFSATLQHINASAQFDLVYTPRSKPGSEVCIPLLEVSRALDVRHVVLEQVGETTWKLTWQEEHPLKNRRVMILPAWQPWQKPWEYKIPDKAHGEFLLEDIALPPARYHLYFYILPGYEAALTEPPAGAVPLVLDLCTPLQRLEALSVASDNHNVKFKNLVEQAIILNDLGNVAERDLLLSKAAPSLIHLTDLEALTGALNWMVTRDIHGPTMSFFLNSIFNFKLVGAMLTYYPLNSPSFQEYLGLTRLAHNIPADSAKLLINRIDDPAVIAACLRSLVTRQDAGLAAIMVKMMREERLSKRDALDLLSIKPAWAIEQVASLPPGQLTDCLLAGLLPKVARDGVSSCPIDAWVERAIPYEEDAQLIQAYMGCLFDSGCTSRFELLFNLDREAKLEADAVMRMLSRDPVASLKALETAPPGNRRQYWIGQLEDKFPAAAGVVTAGDRLLTPFGVAILDTIENDAGKRVKHIRLGEAGSQLNALVGQGAERIRIKIDYQKMTISIDGETKAWKCGHCSFTHPEQKIVDKHARHTHTHTSTLMRAIQLPVKFQPEEISVILTKQ